MNDSNIEKLQIRLDPLGEWEEENAMRNNIQANAKQEASRQLERRIRQYFFCVGGGGGGGGGFQKANS
jgi:hypothetical protein